MKDLNKMTEFDQQWKEAFSDAEKTPPDGLWDKIDSRLSREEAGYFKKRAFIFKLLAAASIAFALGIGTLSINYFLKQNSDPIIAEQIESTAAEDQASSFVEESSRNDNFSVAEIDKNIEKIDQTDQGNTVIKKDLENEKNVFLTSNSDQENEFLQENNNEPQFVSQDVFNSSEEQIAFVSEPNEIDGMGIHFLSEEEMVQRIDHMYLIPVMPRGASKVKKERSGGVFLAGLDFSTGLFDPNFQQGNNVFASTAGANITGARVESVNDQLAAFNATNKDFLLVRSAGQETKADISYSYGANFGFKVTPKIIIQTGLSYRKSNTTTTTTGYIQDAESDVQIPIVAAYQYQLSGLSTVQRIEETSLNNQYEFASIPLRAGYVLLDKKVNLTFLAGISSELFLNNQIGSSGDEFQMLSSSSGASSPYKSVYFNGSLGTMLGYSFAGNYLVTVEPSYRFAVNSFTKNDFYLNSYPSSFMVSFGVAYNFK